jgi:hypothetical protein
VKYAPKDIKMETKFGTEASVKIRENGYASEYNNVLRTYTPLLN